jgi:hypothetical protein
VVDLALFLCKHEFQLVPWAQVLDVLPRKLQIVPARSLAINNYHYLSAVFQVAFRHKTRIHFFLFAHLERRPLSTAIHKQVNIQELAFLNGRQVEKEVLLFVLINLEHMEALALIQISILSANGISNDIEIDLTVDWGSLLTIDWGSLLTIDWVRLLTVDWGSLLTINPRLERQYDKDDEVRCEIFFTCPHF